MAWWAETSHDTSPPIISVSCRNNHFVLWRRLWEGHWRVGCFRVPLPCSFTQDRSAWAAGWSPTFKGYPKLCRQTQTRSTTDPCSEDCAWAVRCLGLNPGKNPRLFFQWELSEWAFGKGRQPHWGQWRGRNCTCSLYFAVTERQQAPCEVHSCCL